MGFGLFEMAFPVIFFLVFALAFGIILTALFRGIKEWNKNNHSPRLTVQAVAAAKRSSVSYHHHNNNTMMSSSTTTYYVTFQVESGDRMELIVPDNQYGYIVEGDRGRLTFQGTRFLSFERT